MKKRKLKGYEPWLFLLLEALNIPQFMQTLQPDGDKTLMYLYGFGLIIFPICFVVMLVRYMKQKKEDANQQ
jgi:hypothetical protein